MDEPIPHDQIWKTVLRLFFGDFLELLDPELAAMVDLREVKLLEQESFTDLLDGTRAVPDLVAQVKTCGGEPPSFLLHVEIELRFRNATQERVRRYDLHLELKHGLSVLSVVVYLRGGPAGIERRELVRSVGPIEVSRFCHLAFGCSGSPAEDFLAKPQPLAAAFAALMRYETGDRVEHKLRCFQAISRAKIDDARRFVLNTVVETYLRLRSEEQERFAAALAREGDPEVKKMVITWEEALADREARGEARGLALGEARGRALGEARGKLQATREAILLLLRNRLRLGDTTEVEHQLAAIDDLGRLQEILERTADARSIADLGLA